MKKTLALILALVTLLTLCSCSLFSGNVELGKPVKRGIAQITVEKVEMADTNYVRADKKSNDFLSPVNKEELELGERFIKSNDENEAAIVLTLTVENVGKNDLSVGPVNYVINYDDGNKYRADCIYTKDENGNWEEFDSITLEKVTSGATEIRMVVWVPDVIINDTASLTLDFHGYTYEIR